MEAFEATRFGNYVLVARLGRGGMAEVFKARVGGVHGFEKTVCVKRILKQHCEDKHFVGMFVNEAKIAARLSHPNVAQVFELGEVGGEYFMAMEYVAGCDLQGVLVANGLKPLPSLVAAYVAREMCRALAYAHEFRDDDGKVTPIVHRDVSPQNVMVSHDGIVKLVDFGIAKALEVAGAEETRAGVLKGKIAYMAPEQMEGAKASPSTDIFAVGVTLHEILTGRRLFRGETDIDTMIRLRTMPIPPIASVNPAVSRDLAAIVERALERDPAKRYPRASQMADDLDRARVGFNEGDLKTFMARLFPGRSDASGQVRLALDATGASDAATALSASSPSLPTQPHVSVAAPPPSTQVPIVVMPPAIEPTAAPSSPITFCLHPEDKRVARIHRRLAGAPSPIDDADLGKLHHFLQATFGARPLRLLVVLECPGVAVGEGDLEALAPGDLARGLEVQKGAYVVADRALREQLGRFFKASYAYEKYRVFPLEKPALWHLAD